MEKRILLKQALVALSALIATAGVHINLNPDSSFEFANANWMIYFVLFALFIFLINKAIAVKNKDVMVYSLIAAVLLSCIEIVGYSLNSFNNLSLLYSSRTQFLYNCIEFAGLSVLFYSCFVMLFNFLSQYEFIHKIKEGIFFSNKPRSFFLIWLIIFAAWIPYFIIHFPGICTHDSIYQLNQALGIIGTTGHHPVFHTLIIAICMKIGGIFGGVTAGVAVYSLLQMLLMSCVFSFAIYYMGRKNIHPYIRIGIFAYFAFSPINAVYSVTMWKDILFGGIMLLFTICVIEMVTNTDSFLNKKRNWIWFTLTTIGVILLRNNGFYVFLLSFPFFILCIRKHRKKLIAVSLIGLSLYLLLTGPVYNAFNITKGSSREALSVPLQQIARVVKHRENELTDEELAVIHSILPVENIGEYYNPRLSDPVKIHFNNEYYEAHKMEFFTTWAKMFFRFPKEYIESYLSNSFGYWYPEAMHWRVSPIISENDLGLRLSYFKEARDTMMRANIYNKWDVPVISMLYSIGFCFILLVLSFILVCIKKQYKALLSFVPVFILLLTATASPVFAEYRYVFSLFTCLPVLMGFALCMKKANPKATADSSPSI